MPKVVVNGIALYYEIHGKGPHTVLCLPGYLGSIWIDFGKVLESFDKSKFRIVSWDPPGYGRSYPPEREFKPDWLEKDVDVLEKMMETLGFDRFHILGWSQGGSTGIIFAARNPTKVIKLVTIGSQAYYTREISLKLYKSIADINAWSDAKLDHLLQFYERPYITKISNAMMNLCDQFTNHTEGIYLGKHPANVRCPWLILHAENDNFCGVDNAYALKARNPKATVHLFKTGKHDLHLTETEEFLQVFEKFILE